MEVDISRETHHVDEVIHGQFMKSFKSLEAEFDWRARRYPNSPGVQSSLEFIKNHCIDEGLN